MIALVVCNDAGGAEAVSSYLLAKQIHFHCYLTGPALSIFKRNFSDLIHVQLSDIPKYRELFVGTSATATTEYDALIIARSSNVKSIAIVDSGGNMRMRFERYGSITVPDIFITHSLEISDELKCVFSSDIRVIVDRSYYMARINKLPKIGCSEVCLYLTEPIRAHALQYFNDEYYFNFDEYEALEGFIANINLIDPAIRKIIIRQHPDEPRHKYAKYYDNGSLAIEASVQGDLMQDLELVSGVYGCSNNAMYIAHLAGKQVVSVLPKRIQKYGIYQNVFYEYKI